MLIFGSVAAAAGDDEKGSITTRLEDFSKTFNEGDINKISPFFSQDPEIQDPKSGKLIEGKEAVNAFLKRRVDEMKERHLKYSFTPMSIDIKDSNNALLKGSVEITDKGALIFKNARRIELIKENGNWVLDSVKDIEVAPAPPTHLKELEWLVGNWKDKDENVTINFSTEWGLSNNFILQKFDMLVYDVPTLQGLQVIGWDPIENKIRSAVYDSDGGVGTGVWTKNGDTWSVAMNYILPDGKKGSATNNYTKINDESYKFSSTDRRVNGVSLPNVEPTTVVKEKS